MPMNFESVHNHLERLVFDEILSKVGDYGLPRDAELLEDIACVALNRLPARYIRFDIDLMYYLTGEERDRAENAVREAVKYAADYVVSRSKERTEQAPE
jgi:hypothetical protein